MSAAATAAGYLYASGRMRHRSERQPRDSVPESERQKRPVARVVAQAPASETEAKTVKITVKRKRFFTAP